MRQQLLMAVIAYALTSCEAEEKPAENGLKGKWNWVSTCGGFIPGVCIYPDQTNFKVIEFTDNIYSELNGFSDATTTHYKLISRKVEGDQISLEIKLGNGNIFRIRTEANVLGIEKGETWESYERSFSR